MIHASFCSQLHFHWGDDDTHGSEDEIDGVSYPMELHIVFFKKEYLDATSAMDHPDGLCVIGWYNSIQDREIIIFFFLIFFVHYLLFIGSLPV